MNILETTM